MPDELTNSSFFLLEAQNAAEALATLDARRQELQASTRAENTLRAYMSDLLDFIWWCERYGLSFLPADPATIERYVTASADGREFLRRRYGRDELVWTTLKVSSLRRRLSAIRFLHEHNGHETAALEGRGLKLLMEGVSREKGLAVAKKKGLTARDIHEILLSAENSPSGRKRSPLRVARDRAIILLGFASGLRSANLAALKVDDMEFAEEGVKIWIERSKTDQKGKGVICYLKRIDSHYCPTSALEYWLDMIHPVDGSPLFVRLDRGAAAWSALRPTFISQILKDALRAAGKDARLYGSHSLRRGFATAASRAGVPIAKIMEGRWASLSNIEEYLEEGRGFEDAFTDKLGL